MSVLSTGIGNKETGTTGYQIDQSLRFNDDDTAYLSRTPSVAGDRKTWTFSTWVKRGNLGTNQTIFSAFYGGSSRYSYLRFNTDNKITFFGGVYTTGSTTSTLYSYTTTGVFRDPSAYLHILLTLDTTIPSITLAVNGETITSFDVSTAPTLNGESYVNSDIASHTLCNEIGVLHYDGYLAETHFIDGQALDATDFGEFDTNGVWKAKTYTGTYGTNGFYLDHSSLGIDVSGQGNNWTANNLVASDIVLDSPTNNFCILNPLDTATTGTLQEGNLETNGNAAVTIQPTTGKWYYERYNAGTITGVTYDADISGQFDPTLTADTFNFGQDSTFADNTTAGGFTDENGIGDFKYQPPTGALALCTANLPTPAISDPSQYYSTILDTGANIKTSAEAVFGDGLYWIKDRANVNNHQLIDYVRGTTAVLQSNTAAIETTYSAPSGNSVAWNWKAGGTAVTNTDGVVTSQVSANTEAGFSVLTAPLPTTPQTVGHGLSQEPELIIAKSRVSAESWLVYHKDVGTGKYLILNSTAASATYADIFSAVDSTTFTTIYATAAARDSICYCFHSVEGYSKIGSYTGNGSADGPFIYTGFRPAYVLVKRTDSTGNWAVLDSARGSYNVLDEYLYPESNITESGVSAADFTANGFKKRNTYALSNASGGTYIYMAFAETPFKYANAR